MLVMEHGPSHNFIIIVVVVVVLGDDVVEGREGSKWGLGRKVGDGEGGKGENGLKPLLFRQ